MMIPRKSFKTNFAVPCQNHVILGSKLSCCLWIRFSKSSLGYCSVVGACVLKIEGGFFLATEGATCTQFNLETFLVSVIH